MKTELIKTNLLHADEEMKRFEMDNDETHLMQASEKIYVSFVLLLELMTGGEIKSHGEVRNFARYLSQKDNSMKRLFRLSEILHAYHYEGRVAPEFIISDIKEASRLINRRIK